MVHPLQLLLLHQQPQHPLQSLHRLHTNIKYDTKLTKRPTCFEDGVLTYTCDCGDTYEEPVAKTEHKYVEKVTKDPTCTTAGEKTFTCSLCGDSYTEPIEAKGHTDGPFETTKEATCTEDGERTIYCKECGAVLRTEVIPRYRSCEYRYGHQPWRFSYSQHGRSPLSEVSGCTG